MTMSPTRRRFLRGAGGFTLALPFLPSLVEREARGGGLGAPPKRFVAMTMPHGGVWGSNMYPGDAALGDSAMYGGHTIRRGDLVPVVNGTTASLSPVMTADASKLTAAIAAKMNVLRGLDIMFFNGHHGGGHLGNFAASDESPPFAAMPTIDQFMAWSPSFYPSLDTILVRSMTIGTGVYSYLGEYILSWGWSNPEAQSGTISPRSPQHSSKALFEQIFVPPDPDAEPARPLIVDRVLADYRRLRDGDRRLSVADRARLDEHLTRLDELQRKLDVQPSCENIEPVADTDVVDSPDYFLDPEMHAQYWSLFNDVVVAAFACDTSRIATMEAYEQFSTFPGDWHNDIAHQSNLPDGVAQGQMVTAMRGFFEGVFLDLVTKLDAVQEADGTTLLDHTLVQWTQESGPATHWSVSHPVVTAGSAGGFFRTGSYVDYQNRNKLLDADGVPPPDDPVYHGLPYNQWLSNILQAVGIPPSEFDPNDDGGYGSRYIDSYWESGGLYPAAVLSQMNEILPFLQP